MKFSVYQITNNINKKKYIGITRKLPINRFKEHKRCAKYRKYPIQRALFKYGHTNFTLKTLAVYADKQAAVLGEILAIMIINTLTPNGYNLQSGGEGTGYVFKKGVKMHCVNNNKIYRNSAEAGKDLGLRPNSILKVARGEQRHHKGFKFTPLDKKYRSLQEDNLKLMKLRKNKTIAILIARNEKRLVPVTRDDGKKYKSLSAAARDLNTRASTIYNIIIGKNSTCKGYSFKATKNTKLEALRIKNRKLANKAKKAMEKKIIDNYGNIYYSISDAARKLKLQVGNISQVLHKYRNKTGGRTFKFYGK